MQFEETAIPGCFVVRPKRAVDPRGMFAKSFHAPSFADAGLVGEFPESFWTRSGAGVIRGMHFLVPPEEQAKLVYCVHGRVVDAVLDLRLGSPTYGEHMLVELGDAGGEMLYLSAGLAHGFCVPEGEATLMYHVSTVHSAGHDAGVRWDSAGIAWPVREPVLSDRDRGLPRLAEFESPFVYADALAEVMA